MPAGRVIARRAAQIGAMTAAAVGLASVAYQRYAWTRDRRRHQPPGRLVDIGGRRLHLWQMGSGSPAVVIEPSLGGSVLEWAPIQQALAGTTTVITYDRAGLGWSDPDPRPHTASRMADDLHRLLQAAAIPPPYILVGHSIGGYVVRMYAARHPEQLAGLVLAESSHEDQWQRMQEYNWWRYSLPRTLLRVTRSTLEPDGLLRFADDLGLRRKYRRQRQQFAARAYPPDLRDAALAVNQWSKYADMQELLWIRRSCAQLRAEAATLGDLPMLVISADDDRDRWNEMQAELAALSTRSRHLTVANAGHHVNRDAPEAVVSAIREFVERVRTGLPPA